MRKLLLSSTLLAFGLGSSPALAQQAASSAFAVGVNQTVTVPPAVGVPPVANVNVSVGPLAATSVNTAPPSASTQTATVASLNENFALNTTGVAPATVVVNEALRTGILTSTSSTTASMAQAVANIQNSAVTIGTTSLAGTSSLFNLMTGVITSMSTATAGGVSGTSSIANATLTGSLFTPAQLDSFASLFASASPNTILFNALGLTITLNEQILLGTTGITTNAIDIRFTNFATGTGFKNGSIILGSTTAAFSAAGGVPEPSTWAMMLLGFGAIGFAVRRSKKSPTLALQTN